MIVYVAAGGMLATSWVQIVKAVLLLSAGVIVLLMALWQIGFDPLIFFSADEARYGPSFLLPGNLLKNPWDEVSLGLGYALGLAGLPHVMTRFYTVPDAKTARRSVVWVMFLAARFSPAPRKTLPSSPRRCGRSPCLDSWPLPLRLLRTAAVSIDCCVLSISLR